LSLSLAEEWLHVLANDLPNSSDELASEEVETHKRLLPQFRRWLESRAKQGRIMVGADSDGMESLMWLYLRLQNYPAVLTGRRLAITKSGKVGVVPKQVQIGDVAVFLAGSLVSLVLRRQEGLAQELETEIKDAFKGKNVHDAALGKRTPLPCDLLTLPIQKCSLVGECYVEGEVGWKFGEDPKGGYTIYALR